MFITLKMSQKERMELCIFGRHGRTAFNNVPLGRVVIVNWDEKDLPQMLSHEHMHSLLEDLVSERASNWLDTLEVYDGNKICWLF